MCVSVASGVIVYISESIVVFLGTVWLNAVQIFGGQQQRAGVGRALDTRPRTTRAGSSLGCVMR